MEFEFDFKKSQSNLEKHKIDFYEAQLVWEDSKRIYFKCEFETEPRFGIVGSIKGKIWTIIYTLRGNKLRIISARRSRDSEEKKYNNRRGI